MGNFTELIVWQKAKDLAVYVYKVTGNLYYRRDLGIQDQMRRASVSIPSNIAEGDESGSNKMAIRYFNISKGSSAELITQTIISFEIAYLSKDECDEIINKTEEISKMLTSLIKSRRVSP